jgi:hypothetical protein
VENLESYEFLDDKGGEKKGKLDWLNLELMSRIIFDL